MSQPPLPNSPMLPISQTGIREADESLAELWKLEATPVTEHAEIFTRIHNSLNTALTNIEN